MTLKSKVENGDVISKIIHVAPDVIEKIEKKAINKKGKK